MPEQNKAKSSIVAPYNTNIDRYLPKKFESLEFVKGLRKELVAGLQNFSCTTPDQEKALELAKKCRKQERCDSGLCPVCQRLFRKKFMRFCDREKLYQRDWVLMTVRQRRWEMKGGDDQPFAVFNKHSNPSDITDIPELRNLIQSLRRAHKKLGKKEPLVIVASVETIFQIVGNKTVTKPFHFHLMISGLTKAEVEKASKMLRKNLGPSVSGMARAVDFKDVGRTKAHFIRSMTYPVKLPFWKFSKGNANVAKGQPQTPTAEQLGELACNFGSLKCTGRFTFVGLKYHGGKLRLSK